MLPEEQAENSRYFYELASARFGWSFDLLAKVQAFHFKGGQGAKTGTGGHLPGDKVVGRIAEVRGLPEGTPAVSPPRVPRLDSRRRLPATSPTRCASGRAASRSGTSCRPSTSRPTSTPRSRSASTTSSSTAAAAAPGPRRCSSATTSRCRRSPRSPAPARHLDRLGRRDVTLVITGGLRDAADFAKALALGADAVAIANSAIQAIGCLGMRACHTNNCPVGIATQKPHLRARLPVDEAAAPARPVPPRHGRADAGARPRVRPRPPPRVQPRRPHHLRPRHGRISPASRTGASVTDAERARLAQGRRAVDDAPRGTGQDRHRGSPSARPHPLRRPLRRPRQPLPAPGRPARRGLDREGLAALPVARLRLRPAHRHAAAGLHRRARVRSRSRCATTASTSALPPERRTPARSPT